MLRNLAGKAMEKRQKRELEAAAAKEKRDALAARKTAAFRRQPTCLQHGSATARMRAPQPAPGHECACPEQPCPMAKMKRCAICGDIKKTDGVPQGVLQASSAVGAHLRGSACRGPSAHGMRAQRA